MTFIKRAVILSALTALAPLPAMAADYDPPISVDQADEYVPVEVGSGWYLRGDIAWVASGTSSNIDFAFTPATFSERDDPVYGSIGFGYHFTDYFRVDGNIGYAPGFSQTQSFTQAPVTASGTAKNYAWTGMVNGYVDLGTYVGFTPYVGAGIGVLKSTYDVNGTYVDATTNLAYGEDKTKYSLAYALNAGVAYHFAKNVAIDVGYQYLKAPDAQTAALQDLRTYVVSNGIEQHQVKVGLRYDLW